MCGIAGKYNFGTSEPVSAELIQAMCGTIAHRGPDDQGYYVDGPVGLGHRRLSIIDLSPLGHQPMATADERLWITFNGEIYNFQSLRADLSARGYRFKSQTDTEVILYLYLEYGYDCLQHLRGMFAFAIWDGLERKLFLARDRIGKKPLFYYCDGRRLVFASEIKAILADPQVPRVVNYQAIRDYFQYLYVPAPKTIYDRIHKLEPGFCLVCDAGGIRKQQYWDVSFGSPTAASEDRAASELKDLLTESVALRMISDVPLGAFLSGGIDSSAVVALMAGLQPTPVRTCSIGFDSTRHDEIVYARKIAKRFNTDHHEFTVRQRAAEVISKLAYHFDEPFADSSAVPTYYVSQLAREAVTVALAGDGGDENFAGYQKYVFDDIENRIRRLIPGRLRRWILPPLAGQLVGRRPGLLRRGASLLQTLGHEADFGFYLTNTEMGEGLWDRLVLDDTRRQIGAYDPFSVTRHFYHRAGTEDHLSRILYVDLKTYLPGDILVKVDRMSMAHSLEVRAPFLDHRLIEFAAGLPSRFKYRRGEKKYILKRAFRGLLPAEVIDRPKKGFDVPLGEWLRGELRAFTQERFFDHRSGLFHFFRPNRVQQLWRRHQAGQANHATVLWSLLMFDQWFCRFME